MDYEYFKIVKYKAISTPVTVSLKNDLIPIIGVNECGKTTILKGILAFDFRGDELINRDHIEGVSSLYNIYDQSPCIIEAGIKIDQNFLNTELEIFNTKRKDLGHTSFSDALIEKKGSLPTLIAVQRLLNGNLSYKIDLDIFSQEDESCVDAFCKHIINYMPQMMFFDDFSDKIPKEIEISLVNPSYAGWSGIFLRLFESVTANGMTIKSLFDLDKEKIDSALSDVSLKLEETIAKKWTGMKLGEEKPQHLEFKIERRCDTDNQKAYFTIEVMERVNEAKRVFPLNSRSKGFYWFFNFVMKLMFSPKNPIQENSKAIFLLDEPGSYLHVSAQEELCKKLTTLKNTTVIYCTHSHHLLHPAHIKPSSIKICEKESDGNIRLCSTSDYKGTNMHAFQPIYDALGLTEQLLAGLRQKIVITEGITDFYALQMFCDGYLSFFPSTGARNLDFLVPVFLSSKRKFLCLFDGDEEGSKAKKQIEELFGMGPQNIIVAINDIAPEAKDIEDFFDEAELVKALFYTLGATQKLDKKRAIQQLFFHPNKEALIDLMPKTKQAFAGVSEAFKRKFGDPS